jgi:hypothetical protein
MSMSVELPDELAARLQAEADERGVSPEQLALDLLDANVGVRRRLAFVAIGESTSGRRAAEAEEMLAEGFGR